MLILDSGKYPLDIVMGVMAHHVPGRLGQLAGQRFGRHDPVDLRRLAVVEFPAGPARYPAKSCSSCPKRIF